MMVLARIELPIADAPPFRSQPVDPEPPLADEARQVFACPDHPDTVRDAPGTCSIDRLPLVERRLNDYERLQYWCPMHPEVTSSRAGQQCAKCNGMKLVPRVVAYRPKGKVLAVPETAVIDTGKRRLVYVDRGHGMYDGVEVATGPRAAGYYAVVSGLQAGQKVATAGAFLLDAETRLNPNASGAYFGATTNATAGKSAPNTLESRP
jgi:hypothetical protein